MAKSVYKHVTLMLYFTFYTLEYDESKQQFIWCIYLLYSNQLDVLYAILCTQVCACFLQNNLAVYISPCKVVFPSARMKPCEYVLPSPTSSGLRQCTFPFLRPQATNWLCHATPPPKGSFLRRMQRKRDRRRLFPERRANITKSHYGVEP